MFWVTNVAYEMSERFDSPLDHEQYAVACMHHSLEMHMLQSNDLASLLTLDALLQESSVKGAARRLGLSAPAVSHALARLRERLDDELLVRAGRHMVLTPRADALRPVVRDAVLAAGRVFEPPQDFDPARLERTFTVRLTDYVLVVFGDELDARVRSQAPNVSFRYAPNSPDDADQLRQGTSDLAIGIYGTLPPELKTRSIITDRFVCVVRADHSTVGERLTLDDFVALEHVLIAPRGRPGGYIDALLAERGLERRVRRTVPYFQLALEMIARSDMILTVSERIALKLQHKLHLRILETPLPVRPFALSMVWHPRWDSDPAHRWLRNELVAATEALDGRRHDDARRSLNER